MLRLAVEVLVAQRIATWGSAGDAYDRLQDTRILDVASRVQHIEATHKAGLLDLQPRDASASSAAMQPYPPALQPRGASQQEHESLNVDVHLSYRCAVVAGAGRLQSGGGGWQGHRNHGRDDHCVAPPARRRGAACRSL